MTRNQSIIGELEGCVDGRGVLHEPDDLEPYLVDWTHKFKGEALAAVRPSNTAQVAQVMKVANRHGLAVVPRGGNTGLTGSSVPRDPKRAIVVSLERMTTIRSIDSNTPAITAEAGCILQDLQEHAQGNGLFLPLGLGAEGSCTLGGVVSTNAGGIRALRYGNCRENIMGIEAVLADGSIWNGLRNLRKHNMGFDLKQLLIGSEGTLGIVTAAVVRLTAMWRQRESALLAVPHPAAAMDILHRLRSHCGDTVVAGELIEGFGLDLALAVLPEGRNPLGSPAPWYLLVEVATAATEGSLRDAFEAALGTALESGDAADAVMAETEAQREFFWKLREGVVMGQRQIGHGIKHDVSVPVGAVADFIAKAAASAKAEFPGARPLSFGHIGDGNIHFTVLPPPDADIPQFQRHAETIVSKTHDIALSLGGSISAEHGIGFAKLDEFERVVDPVELELFKRIKHAFDPDRRMNPGVLLRTA